MNILAVDIGSYSVKFIELWMERKSIKLISHQEINVAEARESFDPTDSLQKIQFEIIKSQIIKSLSPILSAWLVLVRHQSSTK